MHVVSALAMLLAASSLVACSTSVPDTTAPAAPMASSTLSPEVKRQSFRCTDGETVELRAFPNQGVAVLVRQGQALELQQQVVASGFFYSNGTTAVRGKGQEFRLEIGRMAPIHCQAL